MTHIREHRSLLASAEKRLLVWMAARLPSFIRSDHLTAAALAAMLGAGVAFALIARSPVFAIAVAAFLVVNWCGDSLDGTVARVRNQQRPRYGYYVDHIADLIGTAAVVGGMGVSGVMTPAIAFALLAAYFMVAAESFLSTHSLGVFRVSFAGVGPTELRIVLAIGAAKVAITPWVEIAGHRLLLLDAGGALACAGLAATFLVSAVRNGASLHATEPVPVPVVRAYRASARRDDRVAAGDPLCSPGS
jgi:phosphatidylglycerophosphate synthase